MIESALAEPAEWIVADQVYFELYRLLRNPAAKAAGDAAHGSRGYFHSPSPT